MKVSRHILGLALLLQGLLCSAQQKDNGPFVFKEKTFDFGSIREADGPVSHTFPFVNTSDLLVTVVSVSPSCSCVSAGYDVRVFAPGEAGGITVTFDPAGLPGQFHQNVLVVTDKRWSQRLFIEGYVKPRERGMDEMYPYLVSDGLQVSAMKARFGFAVRGTRVSKSIGIVNISGEPLELTPRFGEPDPDISVELPKILRAGETGTIGIVYKLPAERIGTLSNVLYLSSPDRQCLRPIRIEGYSVDNLDRAADAPAFRFAPTMLVFRRPGARLKAGFFNDGKSALKILRTECPDGVKMECEKDTVNPGGCIPVRFTLESSSFTNGNIRVFTNDPVRPVREIVCKLKK